MKLTYRKLCEIWGEPYQSNNLDLNSYINNVYTDTRSYCYGGLFVPLVGLNYDGHKFLKQALAKGAKATVISKNNKYKVPTTFTYWEVDNTLKAYQQLALLYRQQINKPIIAITGSVGKTTTRELVKSLLASSLGDIHSSTGNNNNEVGLPLTILGFQESHQAIVLELAMRNIGEISTLSYISQPDIAVITNIGTAHIGRLGSRENIAKAKSEIVYGLKKNGVLIIPYGEKLLEQSLSKIWSGRITRVACLTDDKDILEGEPEIIAKYNSKENTVSIKSEVYKVPLEGLHNAKNFVLAIAVAKELKINIPSKSNLKVSLPRGRSSIILHKNISLLDETYNSSPESLLASIALLGGKAGRRIAIIGPMLELGEDSIEFHRIVGKKIIDNNIDIFILVSGCPEIKALGDELRPLGNIYYADNVSSVVDILLKIARPNDFLLFKASRSIGLEDAISLFIKSY
tara:strand:- start:1674 stop:3050 length:1377 start_codon:yes stop_codon:yes gene_type:complete